MPGTAAITGSNKKSEVELVSERVTKTKKEIEQLKAQLQKLINDGISKSDFTETKQNIAALNDECKTASKHNEPAENLSSRAVKINSEIDVNKAKTFKDNVGDLLAPLQSTAHSSVTLKRKDKSPPKQAIKEESPRKTRHYDQDAAREYIKKQREKRRELLKNKKKEVDITHDIKKQRLQELRQKSLQLVSKNIQHKRERSRSRSRDTLDQPECKHAELNGGKAAQIQDNENAQVNSKSVKAESDLVPNLIESKSDFAKKFAHPQLKNITIRSSMRDLSAIPKLDIPKHIQFDIDTLENQQKFPVKSTEPSISVQSTQPNTRTEQNALTELTTMTPSIQLTILEKHKAAIKIQKVFRGYRQRKLYQLALKVKQKFKEQATKEVQTVEVKSDIPVWLQAPAALPYPYNFISTVKRKLNLAVQKTAMKNDVAVQSSLVEENSDTSNKTEKLSKQINSNNKNSDLKSFLSHKCLDLDMKAIEPLVLIRNSSLHDKNNMLRSTGSNNILKPELNGFVSDSDTSKNIPEISSESSIVTTNKQNSSKRCHSSNADHDVKLKINTDGIKKLKLLQPKRLNFSNESIKSHQSSKLHEEISEHITGANSDDKRRSKSSSKYSLNGSVSGTETDISGRDSIIASNKCDYSQNKVNKKHSKVSSNLELDRHKSSEHNNNINTAEPIIPPQDTLNSFRNYMKGLHDDKSIESNDSRKKNQILRKAPENSLEKSKTNEISLKTPSEVLDNNKLSEKSESMTKTHKSVEKPHEYSSNFTSMASTISSSVPSLKRPSVSLKSFQRVSNSENVDTVDDRNAVASIILKPGERTAVESKVKSNEIHLKFEAELHLLNDFNDSLRQIMAVDKSLMELRNTNNNIQNDKTATTYQTRDTQTSFVTKSSTYTEIPTESSQSMPENHNQFENKNQVQISTINYSRGSEISEQMDVFGLDNTIVETNDTSPITTGLELSQLKDNMLTSSIEESNVDISVCFAKENRHNNGNVYSGLSIEMFEQLIKDEDARIENLKTILKIREKALVDRTKGELAWLEIQKKHLRDSGQLQEISAIKKKQRGLLIKLEHERHEMQRLKQMQKAASKERKSVLREQRNMIKAQLSNTSNMITKIKRNTKEERRNSGPLKVYNIKSHSESIRSETSVSRRSSVNEEIISVVSHSQSIVSHVTEEAVTSNDPMQQRTDDVGRVSSNSQVKTESVKRSLLMREAALQKRRKAAEELLQWHQRLIEEEEKIAELELAASAIINQVPTVTNSMTSNEPTAEKHKFKGSQLNLLWFNMTGREEKKFNDHMTYSMSKISLERFCKDAKKYAISRNKSFNSKKSGKVGDSDSSLSAVDITVTELTQSKDILHNLKNKSEKSKKSKSKSPRSSSEVASQIAISKSKTKDSQDYTSDFESLLSNANTNKESGLNTVSTDDEQKISDGTMHPLSDKNQSEVNKMLSVAEISLSDKDIETIAEKSKTIGNLSAPGSEIVEEKLSINDESPVEIIDDNSTSTSKFNHNTYSNKIADSVPEIFENVTSATDVMYNVSTSIAENEKSIEVEVVASEINQNSTSKDISTDIENDEMKSEILERKLINDNLTEIRQIIKSNQFVPSKGISSNTTNKDILHGLESRSSDVEEDLVSKKDHLLSTTNEEQGIHTEENYLLNSTTKDQLLLSKRNEDQLSQTDDDLLSKTNKNQLLTKINENHVQSKSDEDKLLNNSNGDQQLSNTNDQPITITEGRLSSNTNENLSNMNEGEFLIKTDEELQSKSDEDKLLSKSNGDQLLCKTSDQLLTITEGQLPSKTDENRNKTDEDVDLIERDEGTLFGKTNSEELDESENQLLVTNEGRLFSTTDTGRALSKTNEDQVLIKTNEDQQVSNEVTQISTAEISELSLDKSTKPPTSKEDANRISIENKYNGPGTDTSENKTIGSDDDTEIASDEEWNKLSVSSDSQHPNKIHSSSYIEIVPKVDENNEEKQEQELEEERGEKEDSMKTTTSISKQTESPLLLSYGFIEKKNSDDSTEHEKSPLDEDHVEEIVEDTASPESKENSVNTDTNLSQTEKCPKDKTPQDDRNEIFEDDLKDKILENDIHHTSENQLEDKMYKNEDLNLTFEVHQEEQNYDVNQTFEVYLEEKTKHMADDVDQNNEETRISHDDEKKIATEVEHIDVKKRVSEILADANIPSPRGDKSPRLQDLYITAYDVVSPEHSSSGSPTDDVEQTFIPPRHMYGSEEVEELLKKQLEIEQEIKEIQQQQQKEHIPYLYVREIPNKPPPPYTPPVTIQSPVTGSVLPVTEKQIGIIAKSAADILHNAYLNKNLQSITLSAQDQKTMRIKNNIDKNCYEFVFDLCKEAAIDHYKQFETETGPSWLHLTKRSKLAAGKPLDRDDLEKFTTTKVRQWLGYETVKSVENIKHKWSGKKRDHVDELLVVECQAEEVEWTNYDRDELIVKDELTKDIMNMLLSETAQVLNHILNKKTFLC